MADLDATTCLGIGTAIAVAISPVVIGPIVLKLLDRTKSRIEVQQMRLALFQQSKAAGFNTAALEKQLREELEPQDQKPEKNTKPVPKLPWTVWVPFLILSLSCLAYGAYVGHFQSDVGLAAIYLGIGAFCIQLPGFAEIAIAKYFKATERDQKFVEIAMLGLLMEYMRVLSAKDAKHLIPLKEVTEEKFRVWLLRRFGEQLLAMQSQGFRDQALGKESNPEQRESTSPSAPPKSNDVSPQSNPPNSI